MTFSGDYRMSWSVQQILHATSRYQTLAGITYVNELAAHSVCSQLICIGFFSGAKLVMCPILFQTVMCSSRRERELESFCFASPHPQDIPRKLHSFLLKV